MRGLITARIDPSNARRKLLRLTEGGLTKLAALKPDADARNDALEDQLDPAERAALDRALTKITRHVSEDLGQDMTLRAANSLPPTSENTDHGPLSA